MAKTNYQDYQPLIGLIIIAVIMVFMALLTDIYWLAALIGRPFPRSIPLSSEVAQAFALPDIIGSLLMYASAYGLLRRRFWGLFFSPFSPRDESGEQPVFSQSHRNGLPQYSGANPHLYPFFCNLSLAKT